MNKDLPRELRELLASMPTWAIKSRQLIADAANEIEAWRCLAPTRAKDLDEEQDFIQCESCGDIRVPHEDAQYSEGCYFCPKCYTEWEAEFDACEHDVSNGLTSDEHGDECLVCSKCSGIVSYTIIKD